MPYLTHQTPLTQMTLFSVIFVYYSSLYSIPTVVIIQSHTFKGLPETVWTPVGAPIIVFRHNLALPQAL